MTSHIHRLEIHLADHCQLNCRGCTHYAPEATPYTISLDRLESDLQQAAGLPIHEINLLGGEPLLHPQLTEAIQLTQHHFPKASIRLVTNGLALEQRLEELSSLNALEHFEIKITRYPIRLRYWRLLRLCRKHGLKASFYNWGRNIFFRHEPLDPAGNQPAARRFSQCQKRCPQLRNGHIYPCPAAAYGPLPRQADDALDLKQEPTQEHYLTFLKNPIPYCRYCKQSKLTSWKRQ